ncbi:lactonase family protein [Paraburkholderia guartelaensis]|uniref:lactonase family protein n=1 Tax=Paraburkholderia guartelaensis TaxID=2546446 RepID=UPI002AB68A93|nr:lactonase family protein [Paraburkholderia guartelaensis]
MNEQTQSDVIFVGAYGRSGQKSGITEYVVDEETGALTARNWTEEFNPAFMVVDPARKLLFTECEDPARIEGSVASYRITDDGLRFLGRQPVRDPCHLALSPSGRYLIAPSHGDGTIVVVPVDPDGTLRSPSDIVQHYGNGPRRTQKGPHPHCAAWTPDGRFVVATDAGNDTICAYELDESTGTLHLDAHRKLKMAPGTAPRHLVFHPDLPMAYVNGEGSMLVMALAYDAESGTFEELQRLPMFTDDELAALGDRMYGSAAIILDRSGSNLYVSNRGPDVISSYAIERSSGRLTPRSRTPSGGLNPRHVLLDASGRRLYVANQMQGIDSNGIGNVMVFTVEQDGSLTDGQVASVTAMPANAVLLRA